MPASLLAARQAERSEEKGHTSWGMYSGAAHYTGRSNVAILQDWSAHASLYQGTRKGVRGG